MKKNLGRPSSPKGQLRNFKFPLPIDEFLTAELARTGKNKTHYLSQAVTLLMTLNPSDRDFKMREAETAPAITKHKADPAVASEAKVQPLPAASASPTISQIPGCLPVGYDDHSLLTVKQFALWWQIPLRTARAALPLTKGVIRRTREDVRIHPATYLELSLKEK